MDENANVNEVKDIDYSQEQHPEATPEQQQWLAEMRSLREYVDRIDARQAASAPPPSADDRVAALETRLRAGAQKSAIGDALAGLRFVNDQARADAALLLAGEVEVRDGADGDPQIIHRATGKPLNQVGSETIQRRLSHLIRADPHPGGGSTTRGGKPAPDPEPDLGTIEGINRVLAENQRRAMSTLGTLASVNAAPPGRP